MVSWSFPSLLSAICLPTFLLFSYLHDYMEGKAFGKGCGNETHLTEFALV